MSVRSIPSRTDPVDSAKVIHQPRRRNNRLGKGLLAVVGAGLVTVGGYGLYNAIDAPSTNYQKAHYAVDLSSARTDELSSYTLSQENVDGVKGQPESYPYLIVSKMDYQPLNNSRWDAAIIGSLIAHPELTPKDYASLKYEETQERQRADFKQSVSTGAPGLEIFFTQDFKKRYDNDKSLRKRVAQDIGEHPRISVMTPEQERQVNAYEDLRLLPKEHWTNAPSWYIKQFAEFGIEAAQEEQKRRKGK